MHWPPKWPRSSLRESVGNIGSRRTKYLFPSPIKELKTLLGYTAFNGYICLSGVVPPFNHFIRCVLQMLGLAPSQILTNGYDLLNSIYIIFLICLDRSLTFDELAFMFYFKRRADLFWSSNHSIMFYSSSNGYSYSQEHFNSKRGFTQHKRRLFSFRSMLECANTNFFTVIGKVSPIQSFSRLPKLLAVPRLLEFSWKFKSISGRTTWENMRIRRRKHPRRGRRKRRGGWKGWKRRWWQFRC